MDRATVSRIEDWDARPVSGGYAGLSELAEADFTGAVTAGGTRLFMLNGRVIGVFDGSISAFESNEATVYAAPDPSLPLLFAMQEHQGEVQGRYYTDDTPLAEVDETLSEGGFTGYIELSENVLSGDYYVVYYGGRSLSAAFVGNEERVVTGRNAFELAADEVGIYEVRSVDLEVTDVPEPPEPSETGAVTEDRAAAGADEAPPDIEAEEAPASGIDEAPEEPEPEVTAEPTDVEAGPADQPTPSIPDEPPEEAQEADQPEAANASTDEPVETPEEAEPVESAAIADAEADAEAGEESVGSEDESPVAAADADAHDQTDDSPAERGESGVDEPDERFREEARWRESRTVPALDPDETELPQEQSVSTASEPEPAEPPPAPQATSSTDEGELQTLRQRVRELEASLESTEGERRRQAERVEELLEERDEIRAERDALQERIERLEVRIEAGEHAAETAGGTSGSRSGSQAAGRSVDPATALEQTDLFIRYDSKGKATLQTAHDSRAEAAEVAENLRMEVHSRFDANGTTVNGQPFQDYLEDTIEFRFVAWLIEDLLYEIRETGSEKGLRLLYDALPKVDRAEFAGSVTSVDDDGEEQAISFDVVCRDRMGKPLIVANINDSLDPATGDMMAGLIEDATDAGEAQEHLAAAFLVTASFFQPDALETASGATGGGFLSRDSKKSFVKLARKGGYHLCLAEARGGDFHVAVPEF